MSQQVYELSGHLSEDCSSVVFNSSLFAKRVLRGLIDKDLEITIKPKRKNKSNAQNRYFWGVVIPKIIAFHAQNSSEDLTPAEAYSFCLNNIMGYEPKVKIIFGQECIIFEESKSLSKMKTDDFNLFKEKIQVYFGERGLIIPDPNQENFLNDF